MSKNCNKGIGGREKQYADRCYWLYNGECIRPDKEPCLYNLGKKANGNRTDLYSVGRP